MPSSRPTNTEGFYNVEQVLIASLRLDPSNPRRISEAELEALTRSIRRYDIVEPIIARKENKMVIGGHQRLVAARRCGMIHVPVIYLDVTAEDARLLNLALNRISGEWDTQLLSRALADLQAMPDIDLTLSGFGEDEISKLLKSLDSRQKRDRVESFDLDAALEAAQRATGVERGDVWRLGDHRLLCGDATDSADVSRLLDGQKAKMAFTDPPYNVAYGDHGGQQRGSRKRRIKNDAMPPEEWERFCRGWTENLVESVDGGIYCCMSTAEWPLVSRMFAEAGAHWSDTIIWAKDRFVLGRADYQRQYEPIWYGWPEGAKRHWCGDRDQGDIWQIARPSVSDAHPTMKPLELVERAIQNSCRVGDIVLDLFLGSGSTLIAGERTGRTCYGLELEPHYCRIVIARWESFTGEKATKLP